jgi:hypothetical protein
MRLPQYLVVGAELIRSRTEPSIEMAGSVFFASQLPTSAFLGPDPLGGRATKVAVVSTLGTAYVRRECTRTTVIAGGICDTNASFSEPVLVHGSIARLSYGVEPPPTTLKCNTAHLQKLAHTMEGAVLKEPCTPTLSAATNITDDTGVATFAALAITSGPPGTYTMTFTAGDGTEASADVRIGTRVGSVLPLNSGGGVVIEIGARIDPQPEVRVVDAAGQPLVGRTVVAFSSQVANIYRAAVVPQADIGGVDFSSSGKVGFYARGQNYALLSGARAETGSDGVARFANLTVTAASSRFVYLNFYCEGSLASWSDPTMRPPAAGEPIKPPMAVLPSFVHSRINSLVQLASVPADYNASTDAPLDSATPITCPASAVSIVEGEVLDETIRVRVGAVDATKGAFIPLPNVTVFALMHTAANFTFPLLFRPDVAHLEAETSKETTTVASTKFAPASKRLLHAASTPSDANGVASFPNLRFSTEGTADDAMTDAITGPTHHRLAFCTAGTTGTSYLSGCALVSPLPHGSLNQPPPNQPPPVRSLSPSGQQATFESVPLSLYTDGHALLPTPLAHVACFCSTLVHSPAPTSSPAASRPSSGACRRRSSALSVRQETRPPLVRPFCH